MDANRSNGANMNHELTGNSDVALSPDGQENVSDSLLDTSDLGDEADLDSMRKRINEMEEEAEKLKRMQDEVDKQMQLPSTPGTRTFVSRCQSFDPVALLFSSVSHQRRENGGRSTVRLRRKCKSSSHNRDECQIVFSSI